METIAAIAIIVSLLGLFIGLPYHQAYQRRLALLEQEKINPSGRESSPAPLDKPASRG